MAFIKRRRAIVVTVTQNRNSIERPRIWRKDWAFEVEKLH